MCLLLKAAPAESASSIICCLRVRECCRWPSITQHLSSASLHHTSSTIAMTKACPTESSAGVKSHRLSPLREHCLSPYVADQGSHPKHFAALARVLDFLCLEAGCWNWMGGRTSRWTMAPPAKKTS